MKGIISSAIYFGLGILAYLFMGEYDVFSWQDPWVYVYMFLWPFPVVFWFLLVPLAIICLILLAFGIGEEIYQKRKKGRNY